MNMETPQDRYIREHSTPQSEALEWLEKQTNIHTNYPRMLSGAVQGRLLTLLVQMTGARKVLEIGTFTGYSAICMAYGLPDDGHVDTIEINDELEGLIREGWERAGVSGRISLHLGDALETLRCLAERGDVYDLVYIDANKREYCDYYGLLIGLVRAGGVILVDDVMLGGKVYEEHPSCDRQTQGLLAFNDMVMADNRVETVMLPLRDGLSIIRKKD